MWAQFRVRAQVFAAHFYKYCHWQHNNKIYFFGKGPEADLSFGTARNGVLGAEDHHPARD